METNIGQPAQRVSETPVESGVDGVQPVPRHTGHLRFDVIISLTAIFISAVSLFVAIEHGKTERDLVAANVWPFPRAILNNGYDKGRAIAIGVSNGGVGPAKIRSFELLYRGRPMRSAIDLMQRCCGLSRDPGAIRSTLPPGSFTYSLVDETVLRPGEENSVLLLRRSPAAPDLSNRMASEIREVTFRVCYCSVLDQCWMSDLRSTRTEPIRQCGPAEHPYDPNGR
ncbi:hypothetical protein [Sphingomonas agri]|uniref:hypothetical protein n=1 Tax=Sphingomonas agri TaxID=1813878 RepID=UPI00311EE0F8